MRGDLAPPGETHTGEESVERPHGEREGGRQGHRVLPEDLFLSNEERRWQLLTLCSQRTMDEVRSSISSSFFFPLLLLSVVNSAAERLVTACLLFIINQYAFNLSDPGTEALPEQIQNTLRVLCS